MLLACQSGACIHQRCDRVAPRKVCAANLSGYSLTLFRLQTVDSLRFDKRFSSHVKIAATPSGVGPSHMGKQLGLI